MLILDLKTPVSIVLFVLCVLDLIPLGDAYDSCDVRHRFVHETGKSYFLSDSNLCNFTTFKSNLLRIVTSIFFLQNVEIS